MRRLAVVLLAVVLWAPAPPSAGVEIKVLSAGAMRGMVAELGEAFRQETGHTLVITSGTAGEVRQKVSAGETVDVVIVTDTVLEQLAGSGLVVSDTRADIARTGIGVAVREGTPKPDIATTEAFKQALLATKSLVYQDPARGATSGIYFAGVLQRLGIADAVKDKTVLWQGGYAAEALVTGKAELCVHQISEIIPVKGVMLVGPLPKELQKVTTYSGGVATKATNPEVARAFMAFLVRPAFKPTLAAAGLDYKE
jgi:molybdate transport system substrate-binding protein